MNDSLDQNFRYLEVAGHRIRYRCKGQGSPLILVHGTSSSIFTWRHNFDALAEKFQVYALDLPGFGFSDKPKINYSPLMFADTLSLFIERLRLDRVHLVGSSLGASICALMTLDYPHKVDRLVLIDPRVYAAKPKRFVNRLLAKPILGLILLKLFSTRAITAANVKGHYYNKSLVTDEMIDQYYLPLKTKGSAWSLHSTMRNVDYSQLFAARAFQIKHPTLILWGEHDDLFLVEEGQRLAQEIRQAKFQIIPEAGHLPHEENPDLVNDAILGFLAESRPRQLPDSPKSSQISL